MGRPVKPRVSYTGDIGFFSRLQQAIEKDTSQPAEWRRECCRHTGDLILLFQEADRRRLSIK